MRGRVTDESSMDKIVMCGIIPAIQRVAGSDKSSTDGKVAEIGLLVRTYDEYFQTGRKGAEK